MPIREYQKVSDLGTEPVIEEEEEEKEKTLYLLRRARRRERKRERETKCLTRRSLRNLLAFLRFERISFVTATDR